MARPLSILDLSPIEAGSTATEALATTTAVAQLGERLGYHRLWVAEHHNITGLASANPDILIAHLASRTERIRLGAGGIMLPNHPPLRIIEGFRLLEALYPGRIDLGLGRAPGTDTLTAYALRRSEEALSGDDYPQLLAELLAFDDAAFPEDHPFRRITPVPSDVRLPPVFLLGSSMFSARLAAQAGLGLAFAAHIGGDTALAAMEAYRRDFAPSDRYPQPHAILCLGVVTADTQADLEPLVRIADLTMLNIILGRIGARPTREQAMAHEFTEQERSLLGQRSGIRIDGLPEQAADAVQGYAERTQADEIMLTTMVPERDARLRMLELMAERIDHAIPAGDLAAVAG